MGSNHLRVLSLIPDASVVGIVEPDPDRRAAGQHSRPGLAAFERLGEAVAQLEPDFACIAVPVHQLPAVAGEAIGLGLAVLVEKPGGPSRDAIKGLADQASDSGVILSVGYVERFNPAIAALKRKLDEGAIGRVHQLHARRLSPFPSNHSTLGVAVDLATHDIDVMRYLTGGDVTRVFAETAQRVNDHAEDLICATLRFDDEATGLLETNWITPSKVRQLSVTGEAGMFVVDYLTQDLYLYENPRSRIEWPSLAQMRGGGEGNVTRFALERQEPLRLELEAFVRSVQGGIDPPVGAEDAGAAVAIAEAIQASGASHRVVTPG
jgi:UDP-N-acetylglucosamine 3-dehydrogenase